MAAHEVEVFDGGIMLSEDRKQVFTHWFASANGYPTDVQACQWAKGVFGGEWSVSTITQEGIYQMHWTHDCTRVDTDYWIELGVDGEWSYLLFRIRAA
jgi:hypothetical protein